MQRVQSTALRSFRRVTEFLAAHTPTDMPASFGVQMAELEDVMKALSATTHEQDAVQRSTRSETQRQKALRQVLWQKHMLPVARLAREAFGVPGVEEALRMPKVTADNDRLVAAARGMADAAEVKKELFTREGLNDDFVEQLRGAARELADSLLARVESVRRRVLATASVEAQVSRGRSAVRKINAILAPRLAGNADLVAAWENAKRLKEPGSGRSSTPLDGDAEVMKVA